MALSGDVARRRAGNVRALAAFGVKLTGTGRSTRTIRKGGKATIYTVGYEGRDADELIGLLLDHGITAVADVRERPTSRRADFRAPALQALCEDAGIEYQPWATLGSTLQQREDLYSSGDFTAFERRFRAHAKRTMQESLARLAGSVRRKVTALLCYERCHDDCHRSVIAELLAAEIDATVIAL